MGARGLVEGGQPRSWWEEAPPPEDAVRVDPVPHPVNHYVVVIPAQGRHIVGRGFSTFGPWDDVVRFEPVAGSAGIGDAAPVTMQYVAPEPTRDDAAPPANRKRPDR